MTDWRISDHLATHNGSMLKTYREMPGFLSEHFGIEQQVLAGGTAIGRCWSWFRMARMRFLREARKVAMYTEGQAVVVEK